MSKNSVRFALGAASLAGLAGSALAQTPTAAPASNQRWDVQFVVDSSGPFAAGPTATAVGISIQARVAIVGTAPAGQVWNNYGVSRVGGGSGVFFAEFTEADPFWNSLPTVHGAGPLNVSLDRSATADGHNDVNGQPDAGHFFPFRGGFSPQGTGGANTDPSNGQYINNPSGQSNVSELTAVVGTRAVGYDGTPLGVATTDSNGNINGGSYATVYRMIFFSRGGYIPLALGDPFYGGDRRGLPGATRNVSVHITNLSATYLFNYQVDGMGNPTGIASSSKAVTVPITDFSFQVPTPGAMALVGLAGLAAARRRRTA